MNCNECQDKVFEYSDKILPEETKLAIKQHLASCETCRALFGQEQGRLDRIPAALSSRLASVRIDTELRKKILDNAAEHEPAVFQFPAQFLVRAAAALVIAAGAYLTISVSLNQQHRESSSVLVVATVYSDSSKTYWTKKTLIEEKKNGSRSYLKIVATRPPRIQTITYKQGENT